MNKIIKEQKGKISQFLSSSVLLFFGFSVLEFFCSSVASAGGVIEDAPRLSTVGLRALNFLLYAFGFLAIIGLIAAGVLYLTAAGDERQLAKSKKAFIYSIVGIVVALAAMIIVKTIAKMIS